MLALSAPSSTTNIVGLLYKASLEPRAQHGKIFRFYFRKNCKINFHFYALTNNSLKVSKVKNKIVVRLYTFLVHISDYFFFVRSL